MKRLFLTAIICIMLTGCTTGEQGINRGLQLRSRILSASGCSFTCQITADYGKEIFVFKMDCRTDGSGNLQFAVTQPESISAITGIISDDGGKLTFDDKALAFALLTDRQLSPVSAPWIMIKTLRSGYLDSCAEDGAYIQLAMDDSYTGDALHLDIWLNEENVPVRGEILWDGRRILTVEVENFILL